ncbi:Clr5 domain-containing protein [Xylogone sp. PMI_703]|nr:Clr5 domain-containing protein [Xylogone sp. PMI_703]
MELQAFSTSQNALVLKGREHSATQWESMRGIIKQLYLDGKQPLPKVMAILRNEYGFNATARMYRQRLKSWGFRKNCSIQDVQRLVGYRLKMNSSKRKNTPEEDTMLEEIAEQQKILTYVKRRWWRSQSSRTSVPLFLHNPQELEAPEILFTMVSNYVIGSFENGAIIADAIGIENRISPRPARLMRERLNVYVSMLENSDSCRAGPFLLEAFSFVPRVIRNAQPETLYLYESATFIFPETHPLIKILNLLASLENSIVNTVIIRAWKNLLDQFGHFVGSTNVTLISWRLYFSWVTDQGNRNSWVTHIEQLSLHPLHHSEDEYGTIWIQYLILYYKWLRGILDEENIYFKGMKADYFRWIADIYRRNGRPQLAEQYQRQHIQMLTLLYGPKSSRIIDALMDLEIWFTEWDNADGLALVRSEIQAAMDELAAETELLTL